MNLLEENPQFQQAFLIHSREAYLTQKISSESHQNVCVLIDSNSFVGIDNDLMVTGRIVYTMTWPYQIDTDTTRRIPVLISISVSKTPDYRILKFIPILDEYLQILQQKMFSNSEDPDYWYQVVRISILLDGSIPKLLQADTQAIDGEYYDIDIKNLLDINFDEFCEILPSTTRIEANWSYEVEQRKNSQSGFEIKVYRDSMPFGKSPVICGTYAYAVWMANRLIRMCALTLDKPYDASRDIKMYEGTLLQLRDDVTYIVKKVYPDEGVFLLEDWVLGSTYTESVVSENLLMANLDYAELD